MAAPFWGNPSFCGLYADPFAEGNELEAAAHAADGLTVHRPKSRKMTTLDTPNPFSQFLAHLMSRVLAAPPTWLDGPKAEALSGARDLIAGAAEVRCYSYSSVVP